MFFQGKRFFKEIFFPSDKPSEKSFFVGEFLILFAEQLSVSLGFSNKKKSPLKVLKDFLQQNFFMRETE